MAAYGRKMASTTATTSGVVDLSTMNVSTFACCSTCAASGEDSQSEETELAAPRHSAPPAENRLWRSERWQVPSSAPSERAFILQKTEPQNVSTTGVMVVTVAHVHDSTLSMKPSVPLQRKTHTGAFRDGRMQDRLRDAHPS